MPNSLPTRSSVTLCHCRPLHPGLLFLPGRPVRHRVALELGAPIVPSYHFGNSRLMHLQPRSLERFCRRARMVVGVLIGEIWVRILILILTWSLTWASEI